MCQYLKKIAKITQKFLKTIKSDRVCFYWHFLIPKGKFYYCIIKFIHLLNILSYKKKSFCIYKKLVNVVYKCTDTMAALISNAFTLWFILFGRERGHFQQLTLLLLKFSVNKCRERFYKNLIKRG